MGAYRIEHRSAATRIETQTSSHCGSRDCFFYSHIVLLTQCISLHAKKQKKQKLMKKKYYVKTMLVLSITCLVLAAMKADCQPCYSVQEQTCSSSGAPTQVQCVDGENSALVPATVVNVSGSYNSLNSQAPIGYNSAYDVWVECTYTVSFVCFGTEGYNTSSSSQISWYTTGAPCFVAYENSVPKVLLLNDGPIAIRRDLRSM